MEKKIGKSVERKDAWDKVTGKARYTGDIYTPGMYYARLLISTVAHALIKKIDISKAKKISGIKSIILGKDYPILCGDLLRDRPILAVNKVRYYGEPIAVVVANTEYEASNAVEKIIVEYEDLPIVKNTKDAIADNAPQIHENLITYIKKEDVYPLEKTNIASSYHIKKGDLDKGFKES